MVHCPPSPIPGSRRKITSRSLSGPVRERDHGFTEEVDLLELVPEGGVVLGELEFLEMQVIRDFFARR